LNAVREEDLRKQRIPIQIVLDLIDKVFQSIGPTLKAAKGKKLTLERINEVFDKFRAVPSRSAGNRRNPPI
jgi:hypothetical protein